MIPIVGLIVGIYCTIRMIQIPLEMANVESGKVLGMPDSQRFRIVVILSFFGCGIIGLLTLCLFFASAS